MTTLKKFMFDTDFDLDDVEVPVAEPELVAEEPVEPALEPVEELPPTFTEVELAAARAEGFSQGKQEGLGESLNSVEAKLSESLTNLNTQIQTVAVEQARANEQLQNDAVALSLALVRKVLPTFNGQNALDEVERMVISVVGSLLDIPRIVLKVNESLAEPNSERMEQHLSLAGFVGDFSVVGDSDIAMGDCRVEWASGYAERNLDDLMAELDGIVARNLDGPTPAAQADAETNTVTEALVAEAAEKSDETPAPGGPVEETSADNADTDQPGSTPVADALEEFGAGDTEDPDTIKTINEGTDPLPSSEAATDDDPV